MELLDGLDEAQRRAVTAPTGPVCVLAPAGSGKTRVLTRRIAWRAGRGDLDVRRTLAITFTTRAARELADRLGVLLGRDTGTTGTFHAVAYRMLRDHHAERRTTPPTVLESPRSLLADCIPERHRRHLPAIATALTWASARGFTPEQLADASGDGMPHAVDPTVTAEVFETYRRTKRRRGVVDFDDMLTECVRLLTTDSAFARAQQWRHRHFFVDEYQDVNPLQQHLLTALLGDRDDLFVVGDPDQAIYAFNGADAGFLRDFGTRHPGATIVRLGVNHRSTPEIVRAADAVLGRTPSATTRPAGVPCTVRACADDDAEALAIARALRAAHAPGHPWRSQAVLVRTHAQTTTIIDLLERAGIPVAARDDDTARDAVRVATFHSAKGLEWPVVHVAGCEEGYVPDHHARSAAALDEERRLLYVALSRATRALHITWARRRRFGDRWVDRSPSRWLPAVEAAVAAPPPRRPRRSVPEPVDPPLDPSTPAAARDRLVRWRASTARAAAVPHAVVLTDAAIDELVRLAPSDAEALRAVPGIGVIKAARYGPALLEALHSASTSAERTG